MEVGFCLPAIRPNRPTDPTPLALRRMLMFSETAQPTPHLSRSARMLMFSEIEGGKDYSGCQGSEWVGCLCKSTVTTVFFTLQNNKLQIYHLPLS